MKRMELGSARLLNQTRVLSLDYILSGYVDMSSFIQIPQNISRSESELTKLIDSCVHRSKSDNDSIAYVFGSAFKDEHGFDVEIHDIHINQGNFVSGPFRKDNGMYQDGGIFFHFSNNDSWVSLILKFTSQSNNTNDHTGNPHK
ncbi:MAG TPA: DUF2278 family protein [Verrucomicrobiae bacterium]|nr:DUF2278 family protein [Verrucomicrobiae bacterium]